MELTVVEIVFATALLIAGAAVGILVSRRGESTRRRALEEELERERTERARYQDSVAQHFGKTSDLFRELTSQYSALYTHLAEGARDLCADRLPSLGKGFTEAPLLVERSEPEPEPAPVTPPPDGVDRTP